MLLDGKRSLKKIEVEDGLYIEEEEDATEYKQAN